MLIVLALVVCAVVYGVLRGGSLESVAATTLRSSWLLAAGLVAQVVFAAWRPQWLSGRWALLVLVASNLAMLVFIALNRRLPGLLLADVGLALNLTVILLNGAMPVSAPAAATAGIGGTPGASGLKHELMSSSTALPWLGDVLPVPGVGEVYSVGDLVLAAGIARLAYARTVARSRRPATAPRASG